MEYNFATFYSMPVSLYKIFYTSNKGKVSKQLFLNSLRELLTQAPPCLLFVQCFQDDPHRYLIPDIGEAIIVFLPGYPSL